MAALTRPSEASYVIHEKVTVETEDRQEHTFCGVMFPIECKKTLPIDHIVITSISVRGALGPLTVWVGDDQPAQDQEIILKKFKWSLIYSKYHSPSLRKLQKIDLSSIPIKLKPNQVRRVYIHSSRPDDQAIVYDNHFGTAHDTIADSTVRILPATAHVSTHPFGEVPIWGWGHAWRRNRRFVGSLEYGVVYRLWQPKEHLAFGSKFRSLALTLFACQRRWESQFSRLPDECIFYILNMMRWDWVNDNARDMARRAIKNERKERQVKAGAEGKIEDANGSDCNSKSSGWKLVFIFLMCIPPIRALVRRLYNANECQTRE